MSKSLKLKAETEDDLVVMSSVLQDSILKVGEIIFNPRGRFLNLRLSRFRNETKDINERVETGLRIDSVLSVKSRLIDRSEPEAFAVLLAVQFERASVSAEDPSGNLKLVFAGGGEIDVEVECVDATLVDLDNSRVTDKLPIHYDG